jgi:hypothetical protein
MRKLTSCVAGDIQGDCATKLGDKNPHHNELEGRYAAARVALV